MFYNLGIPFLDDMICKLVFGRFVSTMFTETNKQTSIQTNQERKKYIYLIVY